MGKITGYSYLPRPYEDPETNILGEIYQPMIAIRISKDSGSEFNQVKPLGNSGAHTPALSSKSM